MTSGRVGQATWRISSRTSRRNWLGFVRWLRRRWTSATDVERRETGAPSAPTCPCRCIMRFCSRFISRLSSLRSCDPSSYEQGRRDSNPQPPVLETGALPIEPLPFAAPPRGGGALDPPPPVVVAGAPPISAPPLGAPPGGRGS